MDIRQAHRHHPHLRPPIYSLLVGVSSLVEFAQQVQVWIYPAAAALAPLQMRNPLNQNCKLTLCVGIRKDTVPQSSDIFFWGVLNIFEQNMWVREKRTEGFSVIKSVRGSPIRVLLRSWVPGKPTQQTPILYLLRCSARLLQLSLPLVETYGFSREALARSVLCLGTDSGQSPNPTPAEKTHAAPLSDTAVSALFGSGDKARRTLVEGWLEEGLRRMVSRSSESVSVRDALRARLEYNEPVLGHLPEVRLVCNSLTLLRNAT